ncbi:hypothetical protein TRVA0_043S00760 [Trichomonascus vanleenenianus]|uniref:translin n=1 Tax=Trichomonascus vanleenenianus TaxID=2268995 RepID=UPI003ECA072F
MHTCPPADLNNLGKNILASQQYHDLKLSLKSLIQAVSQYPYYRFNNIWSHCVRNSVYIFLISTWLQNKDLPHPDAAAAEFNLTIEQEGKEGNFTYEDYLHATISVVNELSRLAINAVTAAATATAAEPDYSLPVEIDRFLKQIQSGFWALNLKNDSLRRRADSIKYDVKKVEEIVYDLALRGLLKKESGQ